MRTTIDIDDQLFRRLKRQASERRITLRQLVNELLHYSVRRSDRPVKYRFQWKVDPPGKIQAGVRLNDRESLFDLMDGR